MESSSSGKDSIIVTEIPYQVNKSALIVRIADLVKEKKIDGISGPERRIGQARHADRDRSEKGRHRPRSS